MEKEGGAQTHSKIKIRHITGSQRCACPHIVRFGMSLISTYIFFSVVHRFVITGQGVQHGN